MVAGVMALREPTSSSLPQTQPQPLPFFQPLTSEDFSSALFVSFLSSARASSTTASGRVETRPATNAILRARSARMPRSHFIVVPSCENLLQKDSTTDYTDSRRERQKRRLPLA